MSEASAFGRNSWIRHGDDWGGWTRWKDVKNVHFDDASAVGQFGFNPDTGARIVLLPDGGWRDPENARFRLFYRYRSGETVEMTGLLRRARNFGAFENRDGSDSYQDGYDSCVALVDGLVGLDR